MAASSGEQQNEVPCSQRYEELISHINRLIATNCAIYMNRQFKLICGIWERNCPTVNLVQESVDFIYNKCLGDEKFATKVITMVATNIFPKIDLFEPGIRKLLLRRIQRTYERRRELQDLDPDRFRSAVRMLGQFLYEARTDTMQRISVLIPPLLSYLDMLLDSAQPPDIWLFTAQIYRNGLTLHFKLPKILINILSKAERVLESNLRLTKECRLCLSFVLDLYYEEIATPLKPSYKFHCRDENIEEMRAIINRL